MSERRRVRAPSMMGNKSLGVGSSSTNDQGTKKKSLSRIGSSISQSDAGKRGKKKKETQAESEELKDFPRDEHGRLKNVVWDRTMLDLEASRNIQTIREKMTRKEAARPTKKTTIIVEKKNRNYRKKQTVGVAVPAPKDIESRPLLPPTRKGPRLDENGQIMPYSILGGVEDYVKEACRNGIYYKTDIPQRSDTERSKVTFAKPVRVKPRHIPNVDERRALQYWRDMIADRDKQKTNIIDSYKTVGFWTQPTLLGEDINGIYECLTQSKMGHEKGVEYVGIPDAVKREMGYIPLKTQPQQHDVMYDMGIPVLEGICATGRSLVKISDELQKPKERASRDPSEITVQEETTPSQRVSAPKCVDQAYPSVLFGGQPITWCKDVREGVAVKAEVGMTGVAGERIDGCLELYNTGPTTVFYDWKKLPTKDTFELNRDIVQRFYFDKSYGIILPGETKFIRAIFKSPDPGVYSEMWKFETRPLLAGGAEIQLTLWGMARAVDVNKEERRQLQLTLCHREAVTVCTDILNGLFNCLNLTESPRQDRRKSYRWIFEDAPRVDDHFQAFNQGFFYHSDVVKGLLELTPATQSEVGYESESDVSSNDLDSVRILSLATLKKTLENLPEEDENRPKLIYKFHRSVMKLSFPVQRSFTCEKMSVARVLFSLAIDNMVTASFHLREKLGILSESNIPEGMKSRIKTLSKDIKGRRKTQAHVSSESATVPSPKSAGGSGRRKSHASKTTPDKVIQKMKEAKSVTKCRQDPTRYRKYKEKLYCETYAILADFVEKLASHLSGLETPSTTIVKV